MTHTSATWLFIIVVSFAVAAITIFILDVVLPFLGLTDEAIKDIVIAGLALFVGYGLGKKAN